MTDIKIIFPVGAWGSSEYDSALDTMLREIALAVEGNDDNWCSKYGTNHENAVFMMHRFCWCDQDTCEWCIHGDHPDFMKLLNRRFGTTEEAYSQHRGRHYFDPPNFWYKPLDFRVTWYKYICRDMGTNKDLTPEQFKAMYEHCLSTAKAG